MQDFTGQATKNGIMLLNHGRCQFCGADYSRGIYDCMQHYNQALYFLDADHPHHLLKFLSVDAHALQHPEIHGRWSNHFHLARLHLILAENRSWDYTKSPRLSDYLKVYKIGKATEFLNAPLPMERGSLTAKDLTDGATEEAKSNLIQQWAKQVYFAWRANLPVIAPIADGFLKSNYKD